MSGEELGFDVWLVSDESHCVGLSKFKKALDFRYFRKNGVNRSPTLGISTHISTLVDMPVVHDAGRHFSSPRVLAHAERHTCTRTTTHVH
jgi:hypothetical protein